MQSLNCGLKEKETVTDEHSYRQWHTLDKYVLPLLGKQPIDTINALETITVLHSLESGGKYSTVKRIFQSLNQIMDYGVNHGLIFRIL